jgi:hypothetical protein
MGSPLPVYQQNGCGYGCCYHLAGEVTLPHNPEPHPSAHRQRLTGYLPRDGVSILGGGWQPTFLG